MASVNDCGYIKLFMSANCYSTVILTRYSEKISWIPISFSACLAGTDVAAGPGLANLILGMDEVRIGFMGDMGNGEGGHG